MRQRITADHILAYEKLGNHESGANVLFGDGHVEWVDAVSGEVMIAGLQAGRNPPAFSATQPITRDSTPIGGL
jgi:prepilin-type processing-associated H-X9-DG protein